MKRTQADEDRRASTAVSKQSPNIQRKKSASTTRVSEATQDDQSAEATEKDVEMSSKSSSKKKPRKPRMVAPESRRKRSTETSRISKLKTSGIKTKRPAAPADVPSQSTPTIRVGTSDYSSSTAPTSSTTKESAEAFVPLVPTEGTVEAVVPLVPIEDAVEAVVPLFSTKETAEAVIPLDSTKDTVKGGMPVVQSKDTSEAAIPLVPTRGTVEADVPLVSTRDSAEAAVPLVPSEEEQSSATGLALQEATTDEPTAANTRLSTSTSAEKADKTTPSKPSEDTDVKTEERQVSGVPKEASTSRPMAMLPSRAVASGSRDAARSATDASAAATRGSLTAGVVATAIYSPPPKEVFSVTSPQDTVVGSGTQAVSSAPAPSSTRALSLGERLRASSILSPISLRLASIDLSALVKSPKEVFSGTVHRHFMMRPAVAAIFVAAALFLVLACFLLMQASNPPSHKTPLCVTDDCLTHANLLMQAADTNIDACEDFYAHVCSRWLSYHERKRMRAFGRSPMEDMVVSYLSRTRGTLDRGSPVLRVGEKPLAMLKSCMSNSSMYGSTIAQFREFMTEYLRLPWPRPPPLHANALEVLISLAYVLQAPFWFAVRPSMSRRGAVEGRWSIVLTPAPLIRQYYLQYRTVRSSGLSAYVKYWMDFYGAFATDGAAASEERAIEAEQLEERILKALSSAVEALPKHFVVIPIGQLDTYTPTVKPSTWLYYLQGYTDVEPALSERDVVLITDRAFFVTVGDLFGNYTNAQIVDFLGWQFVQRYAPVADSRFLITRYGDASRATDLRAFFCSYHVELLYRVVLLSLHSISHMRNGAQKIIDTGYERLVSTAVGLVSNSTWLDSESKALAAEKLASAKLRLWPPAAYLDGEYLAKTYENFPDHETAFGNYWVWSTLGMALLNRTPEYEEVLDMPVNYALPYFDYDYIENAVGVAMGAVNFPLFYRRGTKAMFYGGFGFSAALQLAKALDKEGIRWDSYGRRPGTRIENRPSVSRKARVQLFHQARAVRCLLRVT
ncbi:hypothetical protein HPB50_017114 [Hyalomma asiaticum]|uniref:Uncharacterized protein n=1 Tax=Hyalomma asiaticum TaxID=266040 RepID=A0ACB7RVU6_HYAAI|nr:hypothetical protein HPB50_017114 [Hyalomma asiaticum]